ncbi:MAG TPA: hypothetical protein EYP10_13655, partial [Armatimonadetes bacterium]|nr:hypothetical protein [Armatimonadota bacterium]
MMRILPVKEFKVIITLLTIIALMVGCSSRQERSLTEQYKYDSAGKLVCKIAPDGSKTEYKYNNRSLLTEVKYPGGWVRYGYDEDGNRIWMKDKTGTTEYYYDTFDRLVGVIWKHSPWKLIVYDYDPWGYLSYMAIFNLRMVEQELEYRDVLRELEMKSSDRVQRWRDRELRFQQMMERLRMENAERRQRWTEYEVRYQHDILGNVTNIDTMWGSIKYFYYPDKGQIERRLPNGVTTRF